MLKNFLYPKSLIIPLAYASPNIGMSCLMAPLAIVQGIYAKYYEIPLTTIAMVILVAKFFDAITDPTIGYWADRFYQKNGSRKPFVVVGGVLTVVSGYFLYVPPDNVSTTYFVGWLMLFYLAYTLFEIPHITWGGELASSQKSSGNKSGKVDVVDKTKVYTFRVISSYLGMVLFYTIPQLPIFESSDITPETLQVVAIVAGLLTFVLLLVCITTTPKGAESVDFPERRGENHAVKKAINKKDIANVVVKSEIHLLMHILMDNKPFLLFCSAILFSGIASGMWYGLIFIYVDTYLGMGDRFAQMFMLAFIVGAISAPLWYRAVSHIGKKGVWIISKILLMACFAYTAMLHPGETKFHELVVLKMVQTFAVAGASTVTVTMLSEIADFSTWKYRVNRSATYFAVFTFMTKTNVAIAMALGLAVAGWYGFDVTATSHSQSSVFGLTLAMTWIPLCFSIFSLIFFLMIPLNERRCQIIFRRLSQRTTHAAAE